MIELTGLSKGIILIILLFVIYKTKFYNVVFKFFFGIFDKITGYSKIIKDTDKERRKRQKYINKLINRMKKSEEI